MTGQLGTLLGFGECKQKKAKEKHTRVFVTARPGAESMQLSSLHSPMKNIATEEVSIAMSGAKRTRRHVRCLASACG